jgi:DNA-directed RNA polymerase specialized sigma subunit
MEELIEEHMGLVLSIVNRFNPKNQTEKDDYIQAGRIGLWKALTKFSKTGGSKFSPYAWNPIRWEIIKEIRSSKTKYDAVSIEECEYYHGSSTPPVFWEIVPSTLTPVEEQVIKLRHEGYNFKEISSELSFHRSRIKKIFQSAVKKIRDTNGE